MQQYLTYTAEQFVWDDLFRDWVLHPTPATHAIWQQWLAEHPEKTAVVQQARALVLALQVREQPLGETELEESIRQTVTRATAGETEGRVVHSGWFNRNRWLAAASVALLLALGGWLWENRLLRSESSRTSKEQPPSRLTERENLTQKPLLVNLSDGSVVVLQPRSKLRFPAVFEAGKREVHLTGDAFFEVRKDPKRPFLVFAGEIVTKVLGTSFSVRAFQDDPGISVKVKTGRVAVFHRNHLPTAASPNTPEVVLKANQQVEYSRQKARMTKSPLLPTDTERDPVFYQFAFDDTPLPTVLKTLEDAYGIRIVYDENQVRDCPLTARFADQSLHEMLQFICTALNGSYSMQDGQLVLDIKGCNA
ncbi:FecR family protein [Larkinella insperata]|uniref:FecR family protein n=1 Tax=Larkinella insperata TaxID=332158 RepID=A0ABW3Q298_9BACT|nr:FecR domain-containing protein [Larkinella insperata]